jgi:predicted metalloprotease with PDZ domain
MKNTGSLKIPVLTVCLIISLILHASIVRGQAKNPNTALQYTITMDEPSNHLFHVVLDCKGLKSDTVCFKMPQWMPGYYQIMKYSEEVKNFSAKNPAGKPLSVIHENSNTWKVIPGKDLAFSIIYDVNSTRRFVANNFLDTTHGYIIPPATLMYIKGYLNTPVRVKIVTYKAWKNIATGLDRNEGKVNEFTAPDFDILYDCPILIGNLEELPSFTIKGIKHRFIAYSPGAFDRQAFISNLEKVVKAGTDLIGDIPYKEYTFIAIGPGQGGIEHLNNTTISFTGRGLDRPDGMSRMMSFIGHEYFHNYNVKRIRPYELGPFDYDRENKTNLLWFSEGLSVYYEYLIVRRAGVMSADELLKNLGNDITSTENDEGRKFQSLSQSSYETWSDGPFGNKPGSEDRSISYYVKGPVIGLILDLAIRNATQNARSLDDVMRYLYLHYYKTLQRGFTDAELQQACEDIAGISLSREFEYVYTTKDIDYSLYLSYAALKISEETDGDSGKRKITITRAETPSPLQLSVFNSWAGTK